MHTYNTNRSTPLSTRLKTERKCPTASATANRNRPIRMASCNNCPPTSTIRTHTTMGAAVLLLSLHMASTLMVEKNAPLSVYKGRTAYIHPHDLILSVPDGDLCKVEVVHNDPMSQRVGTLRPAVFDCRFSPYSVAYTHNGSPLLSADHVLLRVHQFAATQTITRVVTLNVRIIDVPFQVFVQDSRLKEVEVREFSGLSNPIDASVLRFRYNYYDGATCIVSFSQLRTRMPMQGQIVRGLDLQPVESLRHDCRDFLYLGLRYKHLSPPTPRVDYLPLSVEVSDPSHGERSIVEHTYLPIFIRGAYPNAPPKASMLSSYILEVEQYVLTPLDPEVVSAEDDETPRDQLVFNVSRGLPADGGMFVHINDHTTPIHSFRQADLIGHQIAYQPPNSTTTTKEVYEVQFTVYDTQFAASDPVTMHIAIRPTNTNAPCITLNKGLRLVEGQSRPITPDNLMVADSDNLADVRFYVKGGLRHGRLEVNGRSAVMFSVRDLEDGAVTYRHDDSDSPDDRIVFRVSDGVNTIRAKFPITVLPRDDSPPYLINNVGLTLMEGGQVQVTTDLLSAHDKDSEDTAITYVLKTYPQAGEIVKKYRAMTRGQAVSKFTQEELSRGLIYYHHLGGEIFSDLFEFRLHDDHEPPNKSGKYGVTITVRSVDDMPPQQVPGTTRQLSVYETDLAIITPESLQYFDSESQEHDLLYTITNQPFFLTTTITIDAGRVVSTDNMTRLHKDSSLGAIHVFTQSEVNHGKVAYMPPMEDVGPIRRHARFHFTVSDSSGSKVMDQPFDITILPVNNQFPHLSVRPLTVVEGGSVRVSINDVSAYDPDTDQDELKLVLDIRPRHGRLLKDEREMQIGDSFTLSDLMRPSIRYVHLGSDSVRDTFTLSVSDGINRVTKPVHIDVKLVNDHQPTLLRNLRTEIEVKEGEETVITSANLAATDNDTEDHMLSFVIIKSPQYGEIQVKNKRVRQFTQSDVWNKLVSFRHTSGETGPKPLRDSATFAVTDQANGPGITNTPLLDLNITVMPVDNQKPYILLGSPLFVDEGERAAITNEVLNPKDVDTVADDLRLIILQPPEWGFIENVTPEPGSEIRPVGKPVRQMKVSDLKSGNIRYVQANHTGLEPISDSFQIVVSDGKRESQPATIPISIVPQNDEKPKITLRDVVVGEGSDVVLSPGEMEVSDGDVPADRLVLSIAKPPAHGKLVLVTHAPGGHGGVIQLPMQDITMDEMQRDMSLVYIHNGNDERYEDAFVLKVTDGVHVSRAATKVRVVPSNDEKPHVVRNAGLRVGYGGSGLVSSVLLRTVDTDTSPSQVLFQLVEPPEKGAVQYLRNPSTSSASFSSQILRDQPAASADEMPAEDPLGGSMLDSIEWVELRSGQNFSQEDVNLNRVRYVHMAALEDAGKDHFRFQVSDGTYQTQQETFEIEILEPRMREIAVLNRPLKVKEGDSKVLTTGVLSASDGTRRPQDMVYTITQAPAQGHIAMITEKGKAVTAFSQLDLAAQKVVYIHTSKADITEDFFLFVVSNGANRTRDGVFRIAIESLDQQLPSLEVNNPLTVVQSETRIIDSALLRVTDPDTPTLNLTYIVTEGPTHGELVVRGKPIQNSRFTQRDVDDEQVAYRNDGTDDVGMDFFLFMVTDLHHDGYLRNGTLQTKVAFFSLLIQPLAKEPPRLINNKRPTTLEMLGPGKYGFLISTGHLQATHPLSESDGIMYTMLQKPLHGYLENQKSHRPIKKRFTQSDVDGGRVAYVLDNGLHTTNDSFMFRVQDKKRNTLDDQRFDLEWSVIELKQSHYIVCEDAGTVVFSVHRRGSVNGSAFVDIRTKDMSGKNGLDFTPSQITQLQFDPGVTMVDWAVQIAMDELEDEGNEKFRIILRTPVNAVLGEHDKATVQIVDFTDGRCDEYIGMISKGQPPVRSPGSDPTHSTLHLLTEVEQVETTLAGRKPSRDQGTSGGSIHGNSHKKNIKNKDSNNKDYLNIEEDTDGDDVLEYEPAVTPDIFSLSGFDLATDDKSMASTNRKNMKDIDDNNNNNNNDNDWSSDRKSGGGRRKNRKRKRKNGRRGGKNGGRRKGGVNEGGGPSSTSSAPADLVAPQSCTRETKGLLYFDLKTARMYRCNGLSWERWAHNQLHNRMFKTEPGGGTTGTGAGGGGVEAPSQSSSSPAREANRKPRDTCDPGWERHRDDCYRVLPERLTWNEGEKVCEEQQNAHLAHVESSKHLEWLRKIAKHEPFWIGMNDKRLHHRWEYTNGGPVRFYHWRRGFPRSQQSLAKHCVLVAARAEWVNRLCDKNTAKVLCVKPVDSGTHSINKWRRRRRRRRRWHAI